MRVFFCFVPDFIVEFLARSAAYGIRLLRPGSEGVAEGRVRGSIIARRMGGARCLIGRGVAIEGWHRIDLGDNIRIHNAVQLSAGRKGRLAIGSNSHIARLSVVAAGGGVSIGEECAISSFVSIFSVTNVSARESHSGKGELPTSAAPVTIGNRVFIGANAVILPGVTIGDEATVAAGAVVTKDVATGETVGGIPAKPLTAKSD